MADEWETGRKVYGMRMADSSYGYADDGYVGKGKSNDNVQL